MAKISERASVTGERAGATVDQTVAALRVLVSPLFDEIEIKPSADRPNEPRAMIRQKAVMVGGDRELNFAINVAFGDQSKLPELRSKVMKGGVYVFSNKCFKLDQRNDLTFKAWSDDYVFLREMNEGEAVKFRPVQTDTSDLFPGVAA